MTTFYLLIAFALILWLNPTKWLLEHYLGTCYRVTYTDINGDKHAFRIISHDPREAILVSQIFKELARENTTDSGDAARRDPLRTNPRDAKS